MDLKIALALFILALTYTSVYLYRLATGLAFYFIQVVAHSLAAMLIWDDIKDQLVYNRLTAVVLPLALIYIPAYMMLGFWRGFGMTPYSTSPTGVLINVLYTSSRVLSVEFIRAYAVDRLKYRHKSLAVYIPTLSAWLLTWFPYPLLSLTLSLDSLKLVYRYFAPSLIGSLFSTFIALNRGALSSVIYNLIPQVFMRISPILPRLDWLIEGTFNVIVPLVGFSIVLQHGVVSRASLRRARIQARAVARMALYFTAVVASIIATQGYIGFRLYVISSGSMEPTLRVGDIILICSYCRDIEVGDIVAYVSRWGVIVHRVVDLQEGLSYVITKGDANRDPDIEPVPLKNVLGKVVFSVPALGHISILARKLLTGSPQHAILAMATTLLIALCVFKRPKA